MGCPVQIHATFSQVAPQKHALIIGISQYQHYLPLNTERDVEIARQIIKNQGFDGIVTVLENEQATHENVITAIETLTSKINKGDLVYIHYSGHGGQMTDNNIDEIDGYDEFFVLYDTEDYDAENPCNDSGENCKGIRDDEMNRYLIALREILGPAGHVMMILDSCFSGTATRDPAPSSPKPRGLLEPFGSSQNHEENKKEESRTADFTETNRFSQEALASLVVISATTQQQLNFETRDDDRNAVGPLSLALARSLSKVDEQHTYSALFDHIKAEMRSIAPYQMPQIEGAVSTRVFSGTFIEEQPYFRPLSIEGDSTLILDGGYIEGLREDTRVVLHTSNTASLQNAGEVLARGNIIESTLNESILKLDREASEALLVARAFVVSFGFGETRLTVQTNEESIISAIKDLSFVDVIESQADLLMDIIPPDVGQARGKVSIHSGDGLYRVGSPIDMEDKDWEHRIRIRLNAYANNKAVREINLGGSITLGLEESFRRLNVLGDSTIETEKPMLTFNQIERSWEIEPRGCFYFKVSNNSQYGVYIIILSLAPDGRLQEYFPPPKMPKEEYYINAGTSKVFSPQPLYCLDPESTGGMNSSKSIVEYKLFASTENPLDFSAIAFDPNADDELLTRRSTDKPLDIIRRSKDLVSRDLDKPLEETYTHSVKLTFKE